MMRLTLLYAASAIAALSPSGGTPTDHSMLTALLAEYVQDGHVDYAALCEDDRLSAYTELIATIDPTALPSDADKLAFWINAYNALTLQLICDNYPVASINDLHTGGRIVGHIIKKTAWDREVVEINGEALTLNNIEHEIIRKQFKEPRIHFALVCAAKSCPPLRSAAFDASHLDDQLEEQGRLFLNQVDKNYVDRENRTIYLSKILDWYEADFGDGDEAVLAYVTRYLPDDIALDIKSNPSAWRIKYVGYDWSLND